MLVSDTGRVNDILEFADVMVILVTHGKEEFDRGVALRLAVERVIINIGEACNRLSKTFRTDCPHIPWSDIVSMRNLMVHDYRGIDPRHVWTAATSDVPTLALEVRKFIISRRLVSPSRFLRAQLIDLRWGNPRRPR